VHFNSSSTQYVVVLDADILIFKIYRYLLFLFLKHTTYIQLLYGQHMLVEIQLLVPRFEPRSPWRSSKVFVVQLPFYIVIEHVKDYIYPITS
jgi:hypothetical protein